MKLNLKQTRALDFLEDDITTEVEYGGGAGGGKSALGCYWQIKRRLKYAGTRGLIGRASLKTLKETTLQTFFEICAMQGVKSGAHFNYNQQSNIITFFNGSLIFLKDLFQYPSDPNFDELGSLEITDAFVDENNQTVEKAWNIVKSRIRYRLKEYNLIPKMLGACNPSKGYIYTRFYKLWKEGKLPADRQFVQALLSDNQENVSEHYRQNLLGLDEASKRRLLYGDWEYDDDPATLINYDKIVSAFEPKDLSGERYITADIARFGKDTTVIGEWDGFKVKLNQFKGLSITESADRIRQIAILKDVPMSRVIVDEDGIGGGVVDILKCKGFMNGSAPVPEPESPKYDGRGNVIKPNYANLKSQCYFRLAHRINSDGLFIDCADVEIKKSTIEELEQVKQYNMDKDGKRQVVPKEKVKELIGRSPDFSDTLMMREWFELTPKRVLASVYQ